jgi:uncharacterized damage-inducible protein DinB
MNTITAQASTLCKHVQLMAHYNQWMNQKLYQAAAQLSEEELMHDRGAFFKSIFATLNHIVVGDLIWLKRFSKGIANTNQALDNLPLPSALDQLMFADLASLSHFREQLDETIKHVCAKLDDATLEGQLAYHDLQGHPLRKDFYSVLMHFFNHQTHHRGQLSTLFSQTGVDIGVTDLNAIVANL